MCKFANLEGKRVIVRARFTACDSDNQALFHDVDIFADGRWQRARDHVWLYPRRWWRHLAHGDVIEFEAKVHTYITCERDERKLNFRSIKHVGRVE